MKNVLKLALAVSGILLTAQVFAQSDNCSSATVLSVTANCSSPVAGTTSGATQSISGCVGNADDDVWYQFVATATSHQITVTPSATFDPVVQLLSGACATLVSINCQDIGGNGTAENIYATGLTIGATYRIRVYHYGAGSGSSTFTICLTTPPPPPANDNCAGAVSLTVNAACVTTAGTTVGATQSSVGCVGTADDDVWFSFVATNAVQTITVDPSVNMDAVVQLYSGACASLTSISCMDNGFSNGNEVINAVGLVPGQTYRIRVYDYFNATGGAPFTICVTGTPTATPTNDEPCNAIALPAVTSACNYMNFTTIGATASLGAPTPSACVGGSAPQQGGFSATSADVWFSITVPATGNIYITPQPNSGINDAVMALYSGICGALTQIACSDDNNYPGGANDLKPYIAATGLTPGTTVFLRCWAYGSGTGNFGICVSSPTNDACANALYICDLNGYSASTNAAYTADRPCNMRGNAEVAGTYAYTPGTNTGGIFGQGGAWGIGSPAFDVQINNNSWIKFTAAATTATLGVSIGNCWVGNYPSGGIQMQIFSGTNCCNFIPVSDFKENSTGFTITANGLTVGNDYYLMVDGFAGDICNYTITANSGVLFPAITSSANAVCFNSPVTLTAPVGATSYEWLPGGQTTQVITVSPSTTTTYTCIVEGVCGYKQTLTKTVMVNPLPTVQINSGNAVNVCNGSSVTLTASGATNYSWNTGATSTSISVNPTSNTTYTVTGTDANGCVAQGTTSVSVLSLPAIAVNSPTICFGQSATLTSSGASTTSNYSWSNGVNSTNTITVSPTTATSYTVTGTAANGCTSTAVSSVTVNTVPTITLGAVTICNGQTATLTGNGASSTSNYSWSTGASGTNTISVSPASNTSYTVTGTGANGCTNTASAMVTVNSLPNITVNSATICNGQSVNLTANNGNTYSWNTGASGPVISVNPASTTSYTVTGVAANSCSNTAVATVTVNSVPSMSTAPVSSPSNCGQSTGALTGVVVNGNGTLTYSWTNASNTVVGTSANLNNQPAGVYNLTVTDANSCNAVFGPFNISNPGAPVAPSVQATAASVCVGGSFTLTANSNETNPIYNWTGPNFSSSTSTLTINPATLADGGTYAVTVTVNNCTSPPQTITVGVNALPLANATNTGGVYCSDSSITLAASGGVSYSWTGPSGFNSLNQNPSISPSTVSNSGVYTVVVTDANGCSASDTAVVVVNQTPTAPQVSTNPTLICEGQSLQLFANSTGSVSYNWVGPNGFSSNVQNPLINNASVLQSGIYVVYGTSSSACNSDTTQLNVLINANSVAAATADASVYCSGTTVNLTGSGGGTYTWSGPNAFSSNSQNPSISSSATNNSGTYTLIVTNTAGCSDTTQVSIIVNQTPAAPIAISDTTCAGGSLSLSANGTGTINWYSDAGLTNLVLADNNQFNPTLATNSNATYYITATANGCTSAVTTASAWNYNVVASANANPTSGFIPLNVQFTNASTGVDNTDNFIWNVNNTTFSNGYNASYTFNNGGVYSVDLIVIETESGCTDTATVTVSVDGNITFSVPNIFTPNGDGQNDVFFIISNGLKEVKVSIFDRWGLKMYEYEGVNGSWDGKTTSGVDVSDGTYYYLLYAVGVNGEEFKENGHFMVVRE